MEATVPATVTRTLSIVAMGTTYFSYLQDVERNRYNKPTDEVWGINSVAYWLGPQLFDKVVAMDNFRRDIAMDDEKHKSYVEKIVGCGKPVISDVTDQEWPNVEAYPLKRVLKNIWPNAESDADIVPMIVNTCAYALALAITEGFSEISLYGYEYRGTDDFLQMAKEWDKHAERPYWWPYHMKAIVEGRRDMEPGEPCTMFLMGVAHARGVKVNVPIGSTFADMDRHFYYYGYEEQPKPFED